MGRPASGTKLTLDHVPCASSDLSETTAAFAIEDRTPLSGRVAPSPSVAGGPLSGVGQVVLAVEDLDAALLRV